MTAGSIEQDPLDLEVMMINLFDFYLSYLYDEVMYVHEVWFMHGGFQLILRLFSRPRGKWFLVMIYPQEDLQELFEKADVGKKCFKDWKRWTSTKTIS